MTSKHRFTAGLLFLIAVSMVSCQEGYTPKPHGFVRIYFPEHSYDTFKGETAPFSLQYPSYATIQPDSSANAEAFWYNILMPPFNGTVYLSYKKVNSNLEEYIEDSRNLVYKHSIKADAIDETLLNDPDRQVYGILYDLKGNTASALQFFLTDSSRNFLRGSLYFNTQPNKDSLAPVIQFVREDLLHLINSLEWAKPAGK